MEFYVKFVGFLFKIEFFIFCCHGESNCLNLE